MRLEILILPSLLIPLAACSAPQPAQRAEEGRVETLTPGLVDREIHAGMTEGDVAAALGSPNIVSREPGGRATWIYDKVSSEVHTEESQAYGTIVLIGASHASSSVSQSDRTLTVVIKFTPERTVESVSYRSSRF